MSRTLLLADGSVTIQRVIELSFAHEDIRVLSVADGRKAMQMLESEQPHVVMLDVDLPEMDGYALAAHIRRVPRLKNVPILLLAGAFEPVDQERARDVGSDGVILKPFEPQVVVTRVKELMDQRDRQLAPAAARAAEPAASPGTRQAPPAESVQAEPPKPVRESAFMRVAAREREAPVPPAATPALDSLELPTGPMWEASPASPAAPPFAMGAAGHPAAVPPAPPIPAMSPVAAAPPVPPAAPPRVTLANAFTALLAAEQHAQPPGAPAVAMSEASIEDAVRRVLVRMTDDLVRRIVVDTAERLIREEIERIKATPD